MRKTLLLLAVLMSVALVAGAAFAQADYKGILLRTAASPPLDANLNWAAQGTRIDWEVSQAVLNGPWTYSYILTVAAAPEIEHWILELEPGTTLSNFISSSWTLNAADFRTYNPGEIGPNDLPFNPYLPCPVYGVLFDEVDALRQQFVFTTDIAPVWGDFYAMGGNTTRYFDTSFCGPDPQNPPMNLSINAKILRPGLASVVIPTLVLSTVFSV